MDWLNEAEKWTKQAEIRHRLHRNAEVGFGLPRTLAIVAEALKELGITPEKCGRAGLTATIGHGEPCFLLRADMDALPIEELSGVPFASENGCMHACGHDMHTAMLLGAARLLKEQEENLHGRVRLMFQPAEETLSGAADMIESGVLDGISAGMMLHVMAGVPLPCKTVVIPQEGVGAPSADFFTVTVHGKSCHGSAPQNGVDALAAAAKITTALGSLVSSECPADSGAVLSIGSFHAGEAANVIADRAEIKGSLRAFSDEQRDFLRTRLSAISCLTASAGRATASVNDPKLVALAQQTATDLLGKEQTISASAFGGNGIRGGSEDFAYVSRKIPTVMGAISAAVNGNSYPLHHPQVAFDDAVLPVGSALLAATAANWLKKEAL